MNNRLLYINSIREAKVNFHKDFLVFVKRLQRVPVNPSPPIDLRVLLEVLRRVILGDSTNR